MDEMKLKLSTKFMRGMVAKIISKFVKKKCGYKIDIQLNEIDVEVIDGKAHLHTNVDLEMDNEEFKKLIKTISSD